MGKKKREREITGGRAMVGDVLLFCRRAVEAVCHWSRPLETCSSEATGGNVSYCVKINCIFCVFDFAFV